MGVEGFDGVRGLKGVEGDPGYAVLQSGNSLGMFMSVEFCL